MSVAAEGIGACSGAYPDGERRTWSRWSSAIGRRYTVGVEEEVMVLDPSDLSLMGDSDAVLGELSPTELAEHTRSETHAGVLELATGIHLTPADAAVELANLRARLAVELRPMGLSAASAGMHPLLRAPQVHVSGAERYARLADAMRSLVHREPTMALHIHVGVPDPEDAVRVMARLRESIPVLIALAANSPFAAGRATGFASTRTVTFGAFPRTGAPRPFHNYEEYVSAIDSLLVSGAVPDITHLWWDVRLQPALGTVEVRSMDAQTTVADSLPLIALVQSMARLELESDSPAPTSPPEVLEENRFLAARDGPDASLVDPVRGRLVSVRALVDRLVCACRPHAAALGCRSELERLPALAGGGGAWRQRRLAGSAGGLRALVGELADRFAPPVTVRAVAASR